MVCYWVFCIGACFSFYYAFNFSTISSTSIPCTAHASSNVSICEAGHPKQCIPTSSNNSAFSTPGNAQLVDDKENDDTKQFLTIQTQKGNTFYMVIDRSSNTENVYMMSLVDENDLAEFLDETEKDKETEESTVVIPETTPETTPAAEEETEVKKEEKSGMNVKGLAAIVVAAILGFAGIAVYKKHGRSKDEDYVSEQLEFSDGPYVNEEDDEKEE